MTFKTVKDFGELKTPFRNILYRADGKSLEVDLIPECVQSEPARSEEEVDPVIRKITEGAKPVTEGNKLLRLSFEYILAIAADADTNMQLFGDLHSNWANTPRIPNSRWFYPILELTDSSWKKQTREEFGSDNSNWRHIRLISSECSIDVLGEMPTGQWRDNDKHETRNVRFSEVEIKLFSRE